MQQLKERVEHWATIAIERNWSSQWVEGAIFPRELVALLASCDSLGVRRIVESGRQDGYSTMVLGQWAESVSGRVVSIDLEVDPVTAQACRARLESFGGVELRKGDAFELVGAALVSTDEPTALLLDGPKGHPALSMLFAGASLPHLRLLAQHNLDPGLSETELLQARAGRELFYEDLGLDGMPNWDRLGDLELEELAVKEAVRSLDHSTLAMVRLDAADRQRLATTKAVQLSLLQPQLVARMWRLGAHRTLRQVARGSFSLQRRTGIGMS